MRVWTGNLSILAVYNTAQHISSGVCFGTVASPKTIAVGIDFGEHAFKVRKEGKLRSKVGTKM